jgi:hypothetical protein
MPMLFYLDPLVFIKCKHSYAVFFVINMHGKKAECSFKMIFGSMILGLSANTFEAPL